MGERAKPLALPVCGTALCACLLATALALAGAAAGQGAAAADDVQPAPGLVIGGSYNLAQGTTMRGDVNAVGATVTIAPGAALDGHLIAVGGSTTIDGTVTEDVHVYGGALTLGDHAAVGGDVSTDYATFERAAGAVVSGQVTEGARGPVRFSLPAYVRSPAVGAARAAFPRDPLDGLFGAVALGLLAMLVMAVAPARLTRVREAMLHRPVRMGVDGLLTGIVAIVLLVLLAVTLIGIPLTILGAMLLYASVLFGWIAFGDAVGQYLAEAFRQEWSRAVRVAVGAFSLALAVTVLEYVPVLGALVGSLLSIVALGAVRSTRYGGRDARARQGGAPPSPATQP